MHDYWLVAGAAYGFLAMHHHAHHGERHATSHDGCCLDRMDSCLAAPTASASTIVARRRTEIRNHMIVTQGVMIFSECKLCSHISFYRNLVQLLVF